MAKQVFIPQKEDEFSKLLPLAGAAAGGLLAGPGAAAIFQGVGGGLGIGMGAQSLLGQNAPVPSVQPEGDAMSRRMQQIKPPQEAIETGLASLQYLPKDIQKEYEPVLTQARQKYRGVA